MSVPHNPAADLTRNQALVYGALARAGGPLSAYAILEELRAQGFRAPLQVYRALDKLVAAGIVHRLESLNAFVACRHPDDDRHEAIAFTICEVCGKVNEATDDKLSRHLGQIVRGAGLLLRKSTVELRGVCRDCRRT
jgi:Fur family transcriptional regulator, zinc uptake regulator